MASTWPDSTANNWPCCATEAGFVFQSFNLLARTSALENVELPHVLQPSAHFPRVNAASAPSRRWRKSAWATGVGHHPSQLSGGQQQRIAIARALVNQPELVLADEPTGNLDTRTSIEIMGLFQELNDSGITIVMVTHELDIAAYCKRIVVMRDGEIISDSPNETRRLAPTNAHVARPRGAESQTRLNHVLQFSPSPAASDPGRRH